MTLIQTDPATAGSPPTTAFSPGDGRPSSAAVEFDGVSRRFGDVLALDDLRLSIRTGETVALLGPNGAGKSTAIGLMLGLLEPTSGAVSVLGMSPRAGSRQRPDRLHAPADRPADQRPRRRAGRLRAAALPAPAVAGRGPRTVRADGPQRSLGRSAVRRREPAPAVRHRHRRRPGPRLPRRADRGHGRRDPAGVLGGHAPLGDRGSDDPVRDPLPRGGRPGRRPDHRPRPRADRRGRHGSCPSGPGSRPGRSGSTLPVPTRPRWRRCPPSRRSTFGATPSGSSRTTPIAPSARSSGRTCRSTTSR